MWSFPIQCGLHIRLTLIETLEKVQKNATKMVPSRSRLSYSNRLKYLNIPTLRYRRYRSDIIEMYKCMNSSDSVWK